MKHKYKINIDQPVPSDEQIARHQDFGRILADYHNLTQPIYRVPLYKNPKAFIGLVLIAVIAGLVFWTVDQENKDKAKENALAAIPAEVKMAEENSFLKAPVAALQVPAVTLDIDAAKPQQLALADGTVLSIPANALGTADGQQATGQVHLQVRQVGSIAELIAMGLPMRMDGKLISPLEVMEITATMDHPEGPQVLSLAPDAKITIEVPVADNALQARQLFTLDPQARAWRSASAAPIQPREKPSHRAAMPDSDGFGVVEYDAQGHIIPKPRHTPDGDKPIHVLQFDMGQLGIVCLGEAQGQITGTTHKVRFTDANDQPLRLLTLYGLARGRNTVEFLWPKTADFAFDISIAPSMTHSYVGFLADGRLASVSKVEALPDDQGVQVLKMQVSAAPIKDLQELTQLIDGLAGL
jgi:hypothetical protein